MYKATKFKASSSNAKANGQVIMPYVAVLKGSELEHLLVEYDVEEVDPEAFYDQQIVCNMQKHIVENAGLFSGELIEIGKGSIESIGFPDEVKTIEDAMGMLHTIYQAIHKDIPEEEGWVYEQVDANTMQIKFNTPYEQFAAYGYIYGIAHKFRPKDKVPTVYMDDETEDGLTSYRVVLKDA
jgi:hypothetical protein